MSVGSKSYVKNSGVSLIEILVAVVVISVGLLGIAALQVSTLQNNHNALLRTQVTALADDILDRMRANRTNAASYARTFGDPAPTAPGGGATQAQIDLYEWYTAVKTLLPPGKDGTQVDGQIDVVGSPNPTVTVRIKWGEQTTSSLADMSLTFATSTGI